MDGGWGRHIEVGRWVQAGAVRTHYLEAGDPAGRPVVLVHGLMSAAQEMITPLGGPLGELGLRVIALDRPGYGLSQSVDRMQMGPAMQARWLSQAIDALGLARPLVAAHSIGCATAICLATDFPAQVGGLVLVNPFVRPTRPETRLGLRAAVAPILGKPIRRRIVRPLARRVGPLVVKQVFAPNPSPRSGDGFPLPRLAQSSSLLSAAAELRAFNRDMIPRRSRLRRTRAPTIILSSEKDRAFDGRRHLRWAAARMPDVEWERVPETGHMLHHVHPELVVSAVRRLLARSRR